MVIDRIRLTSALMNLIYTLPRSTARDPQPPAWRIQADLVIRSHAAVKSLGGAPGLIARIIG